MNRLSKALKLKARNTNFLVINRLEEFAKKVNVTLDTVDFTTKREIIRALVKRVQIYKEEVVVVFRIDPEAPANDATSCTSPPQTGGSIMHRCNRRSLAGAREPLPASRPEPVVRARGQTPLPGRGEAVPVCR